MRDVHGVTGKKQYVEHLEEGIEIVRKVYPTARKEGSIGAWHWAVGDVIVAEAWLHARKPGWWVRVKANCTKPDE
jgi:hypothetical protein